MKAGKLIKPLMYSNNMVGQQQAACADVAGCVQQIRVKPTDCDGKAKKTTACWMGYLESLWCCMLDLGLSSGSLVNNTWWCNLALYNEQSDYPYSLIIV